MTKGFLLLPPPVRHRHNVTSAYVVVSPSDPLCFGEPFLRRLVSGALGPDTVAINWLLALNDGGGYVYNPRTGDLVDLGRYASEYYFLLPRPALGAASSSSSSSSSAASVGSDGDARAPVRARWGWAYRRYLVFKSGVLLSSLFVFFVITNLVAFTLRETQDRMLSFTIHLRDRVRSGAPIERLIFGHVVENLVFVPVMVGMIFFLIEFYGGDKFLAFMMLSVVWVCEVFSVISMRSVQGMQFFPRVFFLYFTLFHVYFFSCPFGFSYTSLASTGLFLLHSMLFFWNRYELPAMARGGGAGAAAAAAAEAPGGGRAEARGRSGGGGGGGAVSAAAPPRSEGGEGRSRGRPTRQPRPRPARGAVSADNDGGGSGDGNGGGENDVLSPLRPRRGGLSAGANSESLPSFPSTDSLGGGRDDEGDDSDSYTFFMNGEVVMHREPHGHRRPPRRAQSPPDRDEPETPPEATPETPRASPPPPSSSSSSAAASVHGPAAGGSARPRPQPRGSPPTPRQSNVVAASGGGDGDGGAGGADGGGGGGGASSSISVPHLGGNSSALSFFDWTGGGQGGGGSFGGGGRGGGGGGGGGGSSPRSHAR